MTRRRLPIGIQTFRQLRERDCYYVDKTPWIARMLDEGSRYFLSRPRRFGKSLLLDTIREVFEGSRHLFEGLHIHDRWDWTGRHPVVRLSFGAGHFGEAGRIEASVLRQLKARERRAGLTLQPELGPDRLADLLEELHYKTGRTVVVLVDEYDKPILDTLREPEMARANRDYLQGLYSVIKDCDEHVRFVFLTGVSKFSKVSLFSGLNNLEDMTLDPRYSGICGYSQADLDTVFAPEMEGLDRDRVREWYNGYGWRGAERLYNPFDVLQLFRQREFRPHWFETGSPSFLVDTLLERRVSTPALEGMRGTMDLLSSFDVGRMSTEALLFQTGYLTIAGETASEVGPVFQLGYPNREVRQSLNASLLSALGPDPSRRAEENAHLRSLLAASDFRGLEELFRAFLAGIPYEWHTRNDIARYEGYYASLFYSWFVGAGLSVTVEESTSRGRLDMAVHLDGAVHVFEFKVARGRPGRAMEQLVARGYGDKYRAPGREVRLVAVEFSAETRNVVGFEVG